MDEKQDEIKTPEVVLEVKLPLGLKIDRFFSKPAYRKSLDSITIGFFILVIIGPIIFIFLTIFLNLDTIYTDVFNDELPVITRLC